VSDPTPSSTTLPAATANIGVQVTLGPNDTPVFLAITVDSTGTHYALVEPVPLGTLTNVITWLNDDILPTLGVTSIPTTTAGSNWPDPIINLFNTLLTASVDVTMLTVDQPAGTDEPYYTTLQVTGKADPPVSLGNLVSIAAAGVMVTSASAAATPTSGGG
jgi:hypothetical protein